MTDDAMIAAIPTPAGQSRPPDRPLPALVQRYLDRALASDSAVPRRVRLTQTAEIRSKPDGRWLPHRAVQEIEVARVGFSWRAKVAFAPLVRVHVVDRYVAGEGSLEARLWGRIPLMRSEGPDVARGEAIRYLAELHWAPHAILANRELEWRDLDANAVGVWASCRSSRVAVRLEFDADGDIVAASTRGRPRLEGKRVVETPWRAEMGDYEVLGGIRVPTRAEVSWQLREGPFVYWRGTVTSLESE